MLQLFSQFLLTSCIFPLPDKNSTWGSMMILQQPAGQPPPCDAIKGLSSASSSIINNSSSSSGDVGPVLQSSHTLGDWKTLQHTWSGVDMDYLLAVELWMTINGGQPNDDMTEPILTLGQSSTIGGAVASPQDDYCVGMDLEVSSYRNHFLIRFRSSDPGNSCQTLYLPTVDLLADSLMHLMVVFQQQSGSSTLSVFINGKPIHEHVPIPGNATSPVASSWQPTDIIQLLGNPAHPQPFQGSLAQVSFYNSDLRQAQLTTTLVSQIEQLYQQGIVRDKPLSLTVATYTGDFVSSILQGDVLQPLNISIAAQQKSTPLFRISMQVVMLPQHGTLELHDDSSLQQGSLTEDQVIPLPLYNASSLQLAYTLASEQYFSAPSINAYRQDLQLPMESFQYILMAQDELGRELARSSVATQRITVVHVNHRPTLTGPSAVVDATTDKNGGAAVYFVSGVILQDAALDFNINRIRVDVSAKTGYLSIHESVLSLADFRSCQGRSYSPWQCMGTGQKDRTMTFVAIPDDVTRILDQLEYTPIVTGIADEILVRVYDGQDGDCLSATEHELFNQGLGNIIGTHFQGCFQAELSIQVPAIQIDGKHGSSESKHGILGTRITTANLLFWALTLVVVICCASCLRRCPRCLARGSKVDPDDGDNDDSVTDDSLESQSDVDIERMGHI